MKRGKSDAYAVFTVHEGTAQVVVYNGTKEPIQDLAVVRVNEDGGTTLLGMTYPPAVLPGRVQLFGGSITDVDAHTVLGLFWTSVRDGKRYYRNGLAHTVTVPE